MAAGPFLRAGSRYQAGRLAPVVIPASGRLEQHTQGNVDVDPPVLEKIGCVAGAVQLLHTDSLLHKTGGMPIGACRGGSGKVPGIFISLRLHDRLFVKEKKNGNCNIATLSDAPVWIKQFPLSVRNRTDN